MPCYLFTYHAYGSWMPDRKQGYVRRGQGVQPPDMKRAEQYRRRANQEEVTFDSRMQQLAIDELRGAFAHQQWKHGVQAACIGAGDAEYRSFTVDRIADPVVHQVACQARSGRRTTIGHRRTVVVVEVGRFYVHF